MCCFSNIAEDYETEKKNLMTKQKTVEDDVKEAEDKNEEIVIDAKDRQSKATNIIWRMLEQRKAAFSNSSQIVFGLMTEERIWKERHKSLRNSLKVASLTKFHTRLNLQVWNTTLQKILFDLRVEILHKNNSVRRQKMMTTIWLDFMGWGIW